MVPLEIINSESIEMLKRKTQNWESKDCYCYLCMTYINNLVFVNAILMVCFVVKKDVFYISKVLVDIFGANMLMCFMFCKICMLKVLIVYFCKYVLEKRFLIRI